MNTPLDAQERWRTAYHEAGHAVVGAVLGGNVKWLSIETRADEVGCCTFEDNEFPDMTDVLDAEPAEQRGALVQAALLIRLAGYAAEDLLAGQEGRLHEGTKRIWTLGGVDGDVAWELVETFGNELIADDPRTDTLDRDSNYIAARYHEARALLHQHWQAVEKIASQVHLCGWLSGGDVHRVLGLPWRIGGNPCLMARDGQQMHAWLEKHGRGRPPSAVD